MKESDVSMCICNLRPFAPQVAQLRLVAQEAEQAAADGAAALWDETRRAARDQGLMRAELASANQQIQVTAFGWHIFQ